MEIDVKSRRRRKKPRSQWKDQISEDFREREQLGLKQVMETCGDMRCHPIEKWETPNRGRKGFCRSFSGHSSSLGNKTLRQDKKKNTLTT